ncbi:hypothetical protein RHGRI_004154 [Rhododendron griersonianum]|uniref:non-specific serine/threonine protein kinase n=1 Tax=Rhododendron griersonianum TaxID=479676 RepID=A0AAV6LA95_9ERIC|nr:hypothetical protein RHGRI_004154 [Rhododendron griersonianum]
MPECRYDPLMSTQMYPKAMRSPVPLIIILFILICFGAGGTQGQTRRIPDDEMAALRAIAQQLGKTDWNLSLNECDENGNWYAPVKDGLYNSTVNCTCLGDVCHISAIYLKGQDLPGVLPKSIANLSYLRYLDLNRNFLSGSIPPEWTSTKLEFLGLSVNRLSGTIPKYLGRMISLTNLSLESNMFEGTVPAELGNLVNLQYFNLNSNNLTGELPKELLNNLTNLREVRLSSNSFTGKLPSFQSWEQLRILELEASGFEGPIPFNISHLRNLTELRIADLNGGVASNFPPLEDMREMKRLMLRSCNIFGSIPSYLGNFPALNELDLTYNRLEGNITNLEAVQWIYLTRNFLTGPIPSWTTTRPTRYVIHPQLLTCSEASPVGTTRKILTQWNFTVCISVSRDFAQDFAQCLKNTPCTGSRYSLHINCGGEQVTIGKTTYESDEIEGDAAEFVHQVSYWGFSSTGRIWDFQNTYYIAKNVSVLKMNDSQLYTRARLSPLSLTYYGRCLANGNYTVTLRFAEIIFRDNASYRSLGRRLFDIYIQDELDSKDFDIEAAAEGVDKATVLNFNNVAVTNHTVEIRFYWAGKGTRDIPTRGTYGPLISAISVVSRCLMDLVDPKLGSDFNKEEAMRMAKVALVCTNPSPALRPAMSAVVSMLEGKLGIEELVTDPRIYDDDFRFVALRDKYDELQHQTSSEAKTLMDLTVTGSSSTSA